MQALLAGMDYDFSQFTMEGFARWLEQRRGRRIVFVPWPMPPTLFGAWLTGGDDDYVFYEENTLPIHQAHIQLHEMAHMLCGHPAARIDSLPAQTPLRQAEMSSVVSALFLRSSHTGEIELEAETLASLIQEQALRHDGLEKLTTAIRPNGDFTTYLASYLETVDLP